MQERGELVVIAPFVQDHARFLVAVTRFDSHAPAITGFDQGSPTTWYAGNQRRKGLEVGCIEQNRQQRGRSRYIRTEAHGQPVPAQKDGRLVQMRIGEKPVQTLEVPMQRLPPLCMWAVGQCAGQLCGA
jgi:hypothetical protein